MSSSLEQVFRREAGRLLPALTRTLGVHNLPLAEDVLQDVLVRAFEVWKLKGPPDDPAGWLLKAAKNRAIDVIRRERTRLSFAPELAADIESEYTLQPGVTALFAEHEIQDDQLRMMFSCCAPNLPEQGQLALILKLLCGFGNAEIAQALLLGAAATEKVLSRGKATLMRSGTLYEVSSREQIEKRLEGVQRALYLLFNEGYHGALEPVRAELCGEALRLCGLLCAHPACATPRTLALQALFCFHAARVEARASPDGELLLLEEQDRARWDRGLIAQGFALLDQSATGEELSEYHLEAGIASEHCAAASVAGTRWEAIARLYDLLFQLRPSPVVALNRAIALGEAHGPEEGLRALGELQDRERLAAYPFLPAAEGRLLLRAGRRAEAAESFAQAVKLARNPAERQLFTARLQATTS